MLLLFLEYLRQVPFLNEESLYLLSEKPLMLFSTFLSELLITDSDGPWTWSSEKKNLLAHHQVAEQASHPEKKHLKSLAE